MPRFVSFVLVVLTVLWIVPSAVAAQSLDVRLSAAWYELVTPYRYDVDRRFEAGWNRGADVAARGGVVRTPVRGTVRFVGVVAGRHVVTVATQVGGRPAVTTFTGVRRSRVELGQLVRPGDVIGGGDVVHVGTYDQRSRFDYLPVVVEWVGARGLPADGAAAIPKHRALPTRVSDAVAERLRAAIEGRATGAGGVLDAVVQRTPLHGASLVPAPQRPEPAAEVALPGADGRRPVRAHRGSDSTSVLRRLDPAGMQGLGSMLAQAASAPPRMPSQRIGAEVHALDPGEGAAASSMVRAGPHRLGQAKPVMSPGRRIAPPGSTGVEIGAVAPSGAPEQERAADVRRDAGLHTDLPEAWGSMGTRKRSVFLAVLVVTALLAVVRRRLRAALPAGHVATPRVRPIDLGALACPDTIPGTCTSTTDARTQPLEHA